MPVGVGLPTIASTASPSAGRAHEPRHGAIDPLRSPSASRPLYAAPATACDAVAVEAESSSTSVRLGESDRQAVARASGSGCAASPAASSAVASTRGFRPGVGGRVRARQVVELARARSRPIRSQGCPIRRCSRKDWPDLGCTIRRASSCRPRSASRLRRAGSGAVRGRAPRELRGRRLRARLGARRLRRAQDLPAPTARPATRCRWRQSRPGTARCSATTGTTRRARFRRLADPETIGRKAAALHAAPAGARPVATQQVPIVFDPQMAASILDTSPVRSVAARSPLVVPARQARRRGRGAAVHRHRRRPPAARPRVAPVRRRGTATRRTVVVERGVLRTICSAATPRGSCR